MSLKDGLDPRAYNFAEIDFCKAPLWRSHKCIVHDSPYDDIIGLMETTQNVARMFRPCCLSPYNEAAIERLVYWFHARNTEAGLEELRKVDEESRLILKNISITA